MIYKIVIALLLFGLPVVAQMNPNAGVLDQAQIPVLDQTKVADLASKVEKIVSGSSALNTAAIASYSCNTTTVTATGVLSTDRVDWSTSGAITAVTGYVPSASGGLSIYPAYAGTDTVSWPVCNWTGTSITPGPVTVIWGVLR